MSKEIPCVAIAATLSEYRSDLELSSFLGLAYSTVVGWNNRSNREGNKKFQTYLLEYFKRINPAALEEIVKHYDLKLDNDAEMISEIFMPEKEVKLFMTSRVEWKRKVIDMLLNMNKELFVKQIEFMKIYIAANNGTKDVLEILKTRSDISFIPQSVLDTDISHLKNV